MKTLALPFATSERSSVGLEWELALVDSDSGDLRQVAQTVLDAVRPPGGGEHPAIRQELLLNTVEVVSGVCRTVGEAGADLQRAIEEVRVVTDPLRVELMCAGTHAFGIGRDRRVMEQAQHRIAVGHGAVEPVRLQLQIARDRRQQPVRGEPALRQARGGGVEDAGVDVPVLPRHVPDSMAGPTVPAH